MLPKRVQRDEDSGNQNRRKQYCSSILKEVKNARSLQDYVPFLEPFIRKLVKEEVEHALDRHQGSSPNPDEHESSTRNLQLRFCNSLPNTLFTGGRIMSKDGRPLRLILWDSLSNGIVTSGPFSSTKVNIVVLHGDFDPDDQKGWSKEDFDCEILRNREGKRPLLTGELSVSLKNGEGQIGEVAFTDNSSWTRSGKFRLGAKAQLSTNESISEAATNSLKIKDHRGEAYQKHHPPSLVDEMWRLDKIAKDGVFHRKLMEFGVHCVQDFLKWYAANPGSLRSIFGNISNKKWDTITGHAATCTLDDKKYTYMAAPGKELVFNSGYKVEGVRFDGQIYHSVDTLDTHQMREVEYLKQLAYKNINDWVLHCDSPFVEYSMLQANPSDNFIHSNLVLPDANFRVEQVQLELQTMNIQQPTNSSPYNDCEVDRDNGCFETGENLQMQGLNSTFGNSFGMSAYSPSTIYAQTWPLGCAFPGSPLAPEDLPVSNDFQVRPSTWQGQGEGQGRFPGSNNHEIGTSSNSGIAIPRIISPKTRWCKLLSVVKWRILVKRSVAARKWKQFFDYSYEL